MKNLIMLILCGLLSGVTVNAQSLITINVENGSNASITINNVDPLNTTITINTEKDSHADITVNAKEENIPAAKDTNSITLSTLCDLVIIAANSKNENDFQRKKTLYLNQQEIYKREARYQIPTNEQEIFIPNGGGY